MHFRLAQVVQVSTCRVSKERALEVIIAVAKRYAAGEVQREDVREAWGRGGLVGLWGVGGICEGCG
eukprot:5125251-Alexandrium_andersonii.AAC.1